MAALHPRTGRVLWRTHIASNQLELTMFGEPAREPFSGVIIENEGILYHVTQFGVVAALNAENGNLLWVYRLLMFFIALRTA